MNRHQYARWRNYQRTLMAVYWLSEPDGFRCYATNAELCRETGLGERTMKRYLRDLEKNGVIRHAPAHDRVSRRTLVILDHPDADAYVRHLQSPERCRPFEAAGRPERSPLLPF